MKKEIIKNARIEAKGSLDVVVSGYISGDFQYIILDTADSKKLIKEHKLAIGEEKKAKNIEVPKNLCKFKTKAQKDWEDFQQESEDACRCEQELLDEGIIT